MSTAAPAIPADELGRVRRILLIKPSALGDVVHALPAARSLRRRFPGAELHWLVNSTFAPLLDGHPDLAEVIPFDRESLRGFRRFYRRRGRFTSFVRELRDRDYDLAVDLQGLFRSGALAWLSGARVRVGPGWGRELSPLFLTHRVPAPGASVDVVHAVERNLWVTSALHPSDAAPARPDQAAFSLPVSEEGAREVDDLLEDAGLAADDGPLVVIAPAARWWTKQWPAEWFGLTADRLVAEFGVRLAVIGAPGENDRTAEVMRALSEPARERAADLAGRTSLAGLKELLRRADLLVACDSGPVHLADALGVPVAAVYGPTDPDLVGPYLQREGVVRRPPECSPCRAKTLKDCVAPSGAVPTCQAQVEVPMMMARCRDVLGAGREAS